jgi:hypothetical protein
LTTDGALRVAKKSGRGFEPLARYAVAESQTWAHPVILSKQILVKDAATVTLWSLE